MGELKQVCRSARWKAVFGCVLSVIFPLTAMAATTMSDIEGTWTGIERKSGALQGGFHLFQLTIEPGSAQQAQGSVSNRSPTGISVSATLTLIPVSLQYNLPKDPQAQTLTGEGEFFPELNLFRFQFRSPRVGLLPMIGVVSGDKQSVAIVYGGGSGSARIMPNHLPVYLQAGSELQAPLAALVIADGQGMRTTLQKNEYYQQIQPQIEEFRQQQQALGQEQMTLLQAGNTEAAARLQASSQAIGLMENALRRGVPFVFWSETPGLCSSDFVDWYGEFAATEVTAGGVAVWTNIFRPELIHKHFGVDLLTMEPERRRGLWMEFSRYCRMQEAFRRGPNPDTLTNGFADSSPGLNYITATLAGMALELVNEWRVNTVTELEQSGTVAQLENFLELSAAPLAIIWPVESAAATSQVNALISIKSGAASTEPAVGSAPVTADDKAEALTVVSQSKKNAFLMQYGLYTMTVEELWVNKQKNQCGDLPDTSALRGKFTHPNHPSVTPLTEDELSVLRSFNPGRSAIGVKYRGMTFFDLNAQKWLGEGAWYQVGIRMNNGQVVKQDYDFVFLCYGTGNNDEKQSLAKIKEQQMREKCPLCGLLGANYLNAIYQGDYQEQRSTGMSALMSFARSPTAAGSQELMRFVSSGKELTLLEEVIGFYMLKYSLEKDDCFPNGLLQKTFETNFNGYRIVNGFGVEEVRVDPSTVKDIYRLPPAFEQACNVICNQQGAFTLVSQYMDKSIFSRDIRDIFYGIDQLTREYSCQSPIRQQFEANLLKLWQQEKQEPKDNKLTVRNAFERAQQLR